MPSEISPDTPAPAPKATRRGRGGAAQAVELKTFLEACKQRGEDAIPEGDPVFGYADAVGIGRELVFLAWREFKRRHLRGGKRQKDWRQTFDNSVRGAWYGFWWLAPGEPAKLTSKGEAARRAFEAEDAAALAAVLAEQGASAEQGAEVAT